MMLAEEACQGSMGTASWSASATLLIAVACRSFGGFDPLFAYVVHWGTPHYVG